MVLSYRVFLTLIASMFAEILCWVSSLAPSQHHRLWSHLRTCRRPKTRCGSRARRSSARRVGLISYLSDDGQHWLSVLWRGQYADVYKMDIIGNKVLIIISTVSFCDQHEDYVGCKQRPSRNLKNHLSCLAAHPSHIENAWCLKWHVPLGHELWLAIVFFLFFGQVILARLFIGWYVFRTFGSYPWKPVSFCKVIRLG